MNINKLIERVKAILLTPRTEWPVIATESTTVADLYLNYIVIVAAIPAIFGFIKGSLIGVDLPLIGTMRVGIGAGIAGMLLSYALSLVQVYVIALIVDALAPTFSAQKNQLQALKLAAYAFTAAWVASALQIVPWIGALLALAGGIYSIYLLNLGLPSMMQCPPDKSVGYTVVTVIIAIVLSIVIGIVVGSITGGSAPGGLGSSDIEYDKDSPLGNLEGYAKKLEEASKQVEAAGQSGDAEAQTQAIGALIGTAIGGGDKVEALAPEQLKPFLPESLADLPRTDMSIERNAAMGIQISEARATFSDQSGRTLRLEITDTGSAKGLMAFAGIAGIEEDKITNSGFSKTYKDDGRIVHEQWDNGGSGEYSVVVGDRFTVKVSGDAEEFDQLKSALNEINLAGLEALKDTGVTPQ